MELPRQDPNDREKGEMACNKQKHGDEDLEGQIIKLKAINSRLQLDIRRYLQQIETYEKRVKMMEENNKFIRALFKVYQKKSNLMKRIDGKDPERIPANQELQNQSPAALMRELEILRLQLASADEERVGLKNEIFEQFKQISCHIS